MAKENKIDLSLVKGTGPKGRVTEKDLEVFIKSIETPNIAPEKSKKKPMRIKLNYDFYGHISYTDYKGLREVIGNRLTTSKFTAPHAAAMDEVDVTELWDLRKGMNEELKEKGEKLTFTPFIVKAVQKSLVKHPTLNSTLDEENEEIILKEYYNIGVATDTNDGLMVPVVKRVETKGLNDIQKDMDNLISISRDRTIDLADLRGGTFTISNFGAIGGIYGVPIINFPEAAILGVGKIRELPRVLNGQVGVRRIMGISVSFDHRIVDGAEVARFINTLKDYLEHPGKILI
jgi:pyruvate dehydrogenase E2 component (dihydrolipoamide acetyltransferase)